MILHKHSACVPSIQCADVATLDDVLMQLKFLISMLLKDRIMNKNRIKNRRSFSDCRGGLEKSEHHGPWYSALESQHLKASKPENGLMTYPALLAMLKVSTNLLEIPVVFVPSSCKRLQRSQAARMVLAFAHHQ